MSDRSSKHNPAKKFPYLVVPTNSTTPFENIDGAFSTRGRDSQPNRDVSKSGYSKKEQKPAGASHPSNGYLNYIDDPFHSHANIIAHSGGHVTMGEFSTSMNSLSMSQMKAILTAQKELRKPAGSLYPTASQISLIPETEMIYKKYFPNDGIECPSENTANRNKVAGKEASIWSKNVYSGTLSRKDTGVDSKDDGVNDQSSIAAPLSVSDLSEATLTSWERSKKSDNKDIDADGEVTFNNKYPEVSKLMPVSDKQSVLKQRDAEARFKKRVQAQLVSLCAEVERQSSDINDMKKELKELLHMSRKNATDNDSSKSRLDTLSKHVHEIDNKVDTLQESVSGQEKSLLSKLMLIGEISDSDSDFEESAVKGIDAISCPSASKLSLLPTSKRPLSSGSSPDCLPKSCCNWVPIAPDFDKLIQAVALINYRMDRNQSMKLCTTNNGATFKHSDVIDLTIFKNGIILGSTGFRSYSTMSVIRFVNEIFNGYLPTELSTQYPDGVVIVLTDKRSVVHCCDENFNGLGAKLSGKDLPDLLPGTGLNKFQKKESMEFPNASTSESVISLPIPSSKASVTNINSFDMLPELKLRQDSDQLNVKIITLKIRERKNGHRYKLKVPVSATVKAVTEHISSAITEKDDVSGNTGDYHYSNGFKSYDLILPVPYGRLSCISSTLEEYGLIQNALLYIQEQQA